MIRPGWVYECTSTEVKAFTKKHNVTELAYYENAEDISSTNCPGRSKVRVGYRNGR